MRHDRTAGVSVPVVVAATTIAAESDDEINDGLNDQRRSLRRFSDFIEQVLLVSGMGEKSFRRDQHRVREHRGSCAQFQNGPILLLDIYTQ